MNFLWMDWYIRSGKSLENQSNSSTKGLVWIINIKSCIFQKVWFE